ncbi:MAG TPA: hypothetical protein VJB57_00290 [Dehalococcoidia bacterium]|nr:hypothetical protein [Dehalococcoidia bacterium]
MVQFRRLDPLANAGPWQRLSKSPVKSFTITEAQHDRVLANRPQLIASERDSAVIALPHLDYLEIHYAFPEVEVFRDRFGELFNRSVAASSKAEAPRGLVIAFRDRPNRALAQMIFWGLALDEGQEWVEMNQVAVPEQPEPDNALEGGYTVREATQADAGAIADIEAEASGQPRLSDNGVASIYDNARWLRVVTASDGSLVGFVAAHSEPGGWAVIDLVALRESVKETLREPLMRWLVAFLRNNGGRRQRRRLYMERTADLALLRNLGFTPGETGIDYTRPVDPAEVRSKIEERQGHGTLIKFGDWR